MSEKKKIPLQCGGFLVLEDQGNPYNTIEVDEALLKRFSNGVAPEEDSVMVDADVLELGAPQPHNVPQGEYEAVLEKEEGLDQGLDMKKALDIAAAIMNAADTRQAVAKVELKEILDLVAPHFKGAKLTWENDRLVIRTNISPDAIHGDFKTLERTLGNPDIARQAIAELLKDRIKGLLK